MKELRLWIGLIVVAVVIAELCAVLEGAGYINFNVAQVPTILSLFM